MGDTVGLTVRKGEELAEIVSLKERLAEREAHEAE